MKVYNPAISLWPLTFQSRDYFLRVIHFITNTFAVFPFFTWLFEGGGFWGCSSRSADTLLTRSFVLPTYRHIPKSVLYAQMEFNLQYIVSKCCFVIAHEEGQLNEAQRYRTLVDGMSVTFQWCPLQQQKNLITRNALAHWPELFRQPS